MAVTVYPFSHRLHPHMTCDPLTAALFFCAGLPLSAILGTRDHGKSGLYNCPGAPMDL